MTSRLFTCVPGAVLLLAPALLLACSDAPATDGADAADDGPAVELDPTLAYLSATDALVRSSMVLRGTRPSEADLRRVHDDPDSLAEVVADYVQDPKFGNTIRDLENETLLLRAENFQFRARGSVEGETSFDLNRSFFEAPLRLVEDIVMSDRPYTDIVRADYLMGDSRSSRMWQGLSTHDASGPEWQRLTPTDGRPAAGILADGAIYYRYFSPGINNQRRRANAISRALLCFDYLDQDVSINAAVDLTDNDAVNSALVSNPACITCHQSLDPFGSFFWVFRKAWAASSLDFPVSLYNPQDIDAWKTQTGRPPSLFGRAAEGVDGLGELIAESAAFSLCAARRFYSYLAEVPLEHVPAELAGDLQAIFIDSGYDAKTLALAVVARPEFLVSHRLEDGEGDIVGYKKARPEQLDRMFEELTGFVWKTDLPREGRVLLTTSDFQGFRVMGGGLDSIFVTRPLHTMNATASLFLRGIAIEAANHVVEQDFAESDVASRWLLTETSAGASDEAGVRAQLVKLHLRVFGEFVESSSEEVDLSYALFTDLLDSTGGDVALSWKLTLTAMFQDLRVAYY